MIQSIKITMFDERCACSVSYHLFCCHRSEKISHRWMALNYAGISVGFLGCYVSGVFYIFYCNNYWRQVYLVTVLAMMLAGFFAQIHPHYLTQKWQKLHSVILCAVAGYSLIPIFHWIWLSGGFSSDIVQVSSPRILLGYMASAAAVLQLGLLRMRPRVSPGQLNYLGSSHQVWHILLVLMFYWWHQSALFITNYRHSHPCPDYPLHS
ncbi:progestin and adipoQ receptor family member 3-like [Xyrauchen texanus]|uniref:progestin and adipoQ receptor family member 3-like n=1 Tax=Xyrauchen texanus TaxID=154827 RepID=UPI002241A5C8|nr:progestin and adipoQ receptor family member 3-like [Xyrauchen texanus]